MPKQQIRFISGLQGKAFIIERFFVTFTEGNASGGAIPSVFLNFIFSSIKNICGCQQPQIFYFKQKGISKFYRTSVIAARQPQHHKQLLPAPLSEPANRASHPPSSCPASDNQWNTGH